MIPVQGPDELVDQCIPHESGDDPALIEAGDYDPRYSPRERG